MATPSGGKKGKKKKGQTVSLNEFLGVDTPTYSPVPSHSKSNDWADETDDLGPVDLAEEYGGPKKPTVDISKLPSAPRASRGLDVDLTKLPSKPPYTAFLGNLPFDISEEEIRMLFRGLMVDNIRFPQDQGRTKGFGYAEFQDVDQLKSALALNGEKIHNRPIRIDIADQAGKDNISRDDRMSRGGGFGGDDRTDGDWRRGGDDVAPVNNRYDDRRGGGFDRRGPRDDIDGRGRPAGPADTDDCWRREDPPVVPASNGLSGDRGGRGDDVWGRRQGGGFRDDRGPRDFRDDRGPRDFRDGRGPRDFRDDRGPRDDFGPRDFRNDRGPRDFREDRGPRDFREDRGPRDYRDDRNHRDYRDNRGPRDDRGPRGFRDDRGPPGGYDDRGGGSWRDDQSRPPPVDRRAADLAPNEPKERPKLSLKPRTTETKDSEKTPTSSIFGGARPVDTAAKERQIEEKLSSLKVSPNHQNRDNSRDRNYRSSSKERSNDDGEGDEENWRDESLRHDKTRVMRPDLIIEAEKGQNRDRLSSEDSDKAGRDYKRSGRDASRGRGRGRGRSNDRKKNRDGIPMPPKYEEPAQPVFGQSSKFSALMADDDDDDETEEQKEQSVGEETVESTS